MTSLSVVSYIERINRMYRLIRKESTGSRAELAGRMRVSERTVSNYHTLGLLVHSLAGRLCRMPVSKVLSS